LSKIQTKKILFPKINEQYQLHLKQLEKKKVPFQGKVDFNRHPARFYFCGFYQSSKYLYQDQNTKSFFQAGS